MGAAGKDAGVEVPDKAFPHLHNTTEFRTEFDLKPISVTVPELL